MNQRIQIIRALAIIAVVAIHTPAPEPYVVFIRPFFNFAVAMFLFLSAFLTESKSPAALHPDYPALIRGRLRRLIPTYIGWVLISSLFLITARHTFSPSALLKTMFLQSWGVPYYFYLVYFQLLLLHPFISRLTASRYWLAGIAVTPLALCARYALHLSGITLPGVLGGCPFPMWFAYYYLGILLVQRQGSCKPGLLPLLALWLFSLLPQMAEGWFWYTEGSLGLATTQLKFTSFLSSIAACLLAWGYTRQASPLASPNRAQRILIFIGNCSMGVFLCHIILIPIWYKAVSLLHLPSPWPTHTIAILTGSLLLIVLANRILPPACCRQLGLTCGKPGPKK